jgi:hypothetical protein
MSDVVEEMGYQMPDSLSGFNIFLAASVTIFAIEGSSAIKAGFFFSYP